MINLENLSRKELYTLLRTELILCRMAIVKQTTMLLKSRVKRPLGFVYRYPINFRKTGHRWTFSLYIRNDKEQQDPATSTHMVYNSKAGYGVYLSWLDVNYRQEMDIMFFDFTPHCLERYRQRELVPHNINEPIRERANRMVSSLIPCNQLVSGNVIYFLSYEGAFLGYKLQEDWIIFKTYISYSDAYINQRKTLDKARADIIKMRDLISKGGDPTTVYNGPKDSKEEIQSFTKKSGMYWEMAHKRNEKYKNE